MSNCLLCVEDEALGPINRPRPISIVFSIDAWNAFTNVKLSVSVRSSQIQKQHFAKREAFRKVELPFPERATSSWNPRRKVAPANLDMQLELDLNFRKRPRVGM